MKFDAPRFIFLDVNQYDIDTSTPQCLDNCMIASALFYHLLNKNIDFRRVKVTSVSAYIIINSVDQYRYTLDNEAIVETRRFDRNIYYEERVEPFSTVLTYAGKADDIFNARV